MLKSVSDKIKTQIVNFKDNPSALALSIAILSLSILGARLQIYQLTMAMMVLICVVIGLSAFNKIKPVAYPIIIYSVALASKLPYYLMGLSGQTSIQNITSPILQNKMGFGIMLYRTPTTVR